MAKVFDIVDQNKKKTQPVQQLAGGAGLPSAPVTAVGTGTLGGTPQQQAMAGTPAQKKSVLDAVTKVARPTGETQLEQARLLRAPAAETEKDQASKAKVQQLVQGLGTFGAKAVELIDSAKQSIFGKPATVPTTTPEAAPSTTPAPSGVTLEVVTPDNLKDQPTEKQASIRSLVSAIANETDPAKRTAAIRDLNIALGKSPDSPMSAAEMDKFYASVTETVSKQTEEKFRRAATGEDNVLNLEDFTALGTSTEELATLFNMAPADVMKLTVTDFQNKLAGLDVGTQEVQATTAGMASGLLSTAERQALRGNLAQLEERGLAGAAVQYKSLLDDIDRGTTVSIGGKQYGIDELLADGTFADIADLYFKDPNSDWAKNLAKSEPGLVQWLTGNEKVLNDLISSSKAAATEFGQLQTSRAAKFKGIDPGLLKELTGGAVDLSKFATDAVDETKLPDVVKTFLSLPTGPKEEFANNLKTLAGIMQPADIAKLSTETLKQMDLGNPDGQGAKWMTTRRNLAADLNSTNPSDVINSLTGGRMDLDDVDAQLQEDNFRLAMGLPTSNLLEQFDSNSDGSISREEIRAAGQEATKLLPSFEEYNNKTWKGLKKISSPQLTAGQQILLEAGRDGNISSEEVAGLSIDELSKLAGSARGKYQTSLDSIIDEKSNQELKNANLPLGDFANYLNVQIPTSFGVFGEPFTAFGRSLDEMSNTIERLNQALNTSISARSKSKINSMKSQLENKRVQLVNQFNSKYPKQPLPPPPAPVSGGTAYSPEVNRETFEGF